MSDPVCAMDFDDDEGPWYGSEAPYEHECGCTSDRYGGGYPCDTHRRLLARLEDEARKAVAK